MRHSDRRIIMKKTVAILAAVCVLSCSMLSCGKKKTDAVGTDTQMISGGTTALGTPIDGAPLEQVAGAVDPSAIEFKEKDEYKDYSDGIAVTLSDSADARGKGYTISGGKLSITADGTYVISGALSDGQIIVDAPKDADVRLVLSGIDIYCSYSAPIFVNSADKVILSLPDGTENTLEDKGLSYANDGSEITGVIYSRDSLSINGTGKLNVKASKDGISTRNTLKIMGGVIKVEAGDDAIVGKDRVLIRDGELAISAVGDGIKATCDTDSTLGYIYIEGGTFDITSDGDAISAYTSMLVTGGDFSIKTGGGSANVTSSGQMQGGGSFGRYPQGSTLNTDTVSAKGLKAGAYLDISGGTFDIDSADDAVHSDDTVRINRGKLTASTGDDGAHADSKLAISGGEIIITRSHEGLEAQDIAISGGYINITSSDDGINAAGGSDGDTDGDRIWQDRFNTSQNVNFEISGGEVYVNSQGDGIDSNGSLTISGGIVCVSGPTNSGNGYVDVGEGGAAFYTNGGIYLGVGNAGMLVTPSPDSQQNSITASVSGNAGSSITVSSSDGTELVSFRAAKQFNIITVSHPDIKIGDKVTVYVDGTSVAELECTSVSTGGGMGGGMPGAPGGMQGGGGKPSRGNRPQGGRPMQGM